MGPVSDEERNGLLKSSLYYGRYEKTVDRKSAYEMLAESVAAKAKDVPRENKNQGSRVLGGLQDFVLGSTGSRGGKKDGLVQLAAKSAVRRLSGSIVRGILGGIVRGK
jgi:hypothetical protein